MLFLFLHTCILCKKTLLSSGDTVKIQSSSLKLRDDNSKVALKNNLLPKPASLVSQKIQHMLQFTHASVSWEISDASSNFKAYSLLKTPQTLAA